MDDQDNLETILNEEWFDQELYIKKDVKNNTWLKRFKVGILALTTALSVLGTSYIPGDVRYEFPKEKISYDLTDKNLTLTNLADAFASSVLIISPEGHGTGTVLYDKKNDNYYLITCHHVVDSKILSEENSLDKETSDEELFDDNKVGYMIYSNIYMGIGNVIKYDEKSDLALLKLSVKHPRPFKGNISSGADFGDFIYGVGFPYTNSAANIRGYINLEYDEGFLNVSGTFNPGASGTGLYVLEDGEANLAGVVDAILGRDSSKGLSAFEAMGIMISEKQLRDFLQNTVLADDYL